MGEARSAEQRLGRAGPRANGARRGANDARRKSASGGKTGGQQSARRDSVGGSAGRSVAEGDSG
eukprot:9333173-Alexandrium_andersonii.AAC.1